MAWKLSTMCYNGKGRYRSIDNTIQLFTYCVLGIFSRWRAIPAFWHLFHLCLYFLYSLDTTLNSKVYFHRLSEFYKLPNKLVVKYRLHGIKRKIPNFKKLCKVTLPKGQLPAWWPLSLELIQWLLSQKQLTAKYDSSWLLLWEWKVSFSFLSDSCPLLEAITVKHFYMYPSRNVLWLMTSLTWPR